MRFSFCLLLRFHLLHDLKQLRQGLIRQSGDDLVAQGVTTNANVHLEVATEMALHVLAYNLTRVLNIVGIKPLLVAIRA
jgi:hypothetical protein